MKEKLKKIVAVLLLLLVGFGWYATVFGVGSLAPLTDKIQLGLDIKGGVYVVMEAQTDKEGEELTELMNQTQQVISRRVDQMGIANADVRVEGGNRIRVELPGVENAQEAIDQIGRTAQLQFLMPDGGFVLDGSMVQNATVTQSGSETGGYAVSLELKSEGADAFEQATEKALSGTVTATIKDSYGQTVPSDSIVIMLDNDVISSPSVNEVISGGKCEITGNFSQEEASELAALIRGGALPAPLEEVSSSVQSAKIGLDAFDQSVKAGIIGIAIIFVIMIAGYMIMGLAADIALAMYILIIFIIMALVGNVITLPGIAGLILSVGMAVDANVVIFTRIKEEIISGKSTRVAVQTGFKRAMSTVIDSQVTTLIAAVILYQIGTSSVKGFAWTLMIGIIVSLLTAVVITHLYLGILANTRRFSKKKYFGIKEDGTAMFAIKRQFSFIKHRKIYYTVSVVILVIGLAFGLVRGLNYGIDFTGGTMVQIDMGKEVAMEEVEAVLNDRGIEAEVVYAGENNEQIMIRTVDAIENDERSALIADLQQEFGFDDSDILAQELFGPTVGKELRNNAIKAVLLAAVGMLIYIRLRFKEWNFGASAILGVLHDVLIVLTFYAVFNVTVNNPFIAGILTVVGYSINDTIVIFDRIRENNQLMRKDEEEIIDISINQTLSRSIMTTFTTLIVMVPMFIMTSASMREFILPLMVGVAAGCLSSIFICSPLYYQFSQHKRKTRYQKTLEEGKKKKKKKYIGGTGNKE
ncbi:protein translocase subunit SecD [Gallibacter intestinalis]|uniref:Multifunctional fusion protein n=1 Tax=Gallibacter intestinalis TaxID=2779356 RepID=A0ABR9QXQ4_9FIRM|nr:protein translocase subunit SecD [Gallibacter intestinalis]MBE5035657.1 protein translocase subunit SecF [Gallibacter intestinalis]